MNPKTIALSRGEKIVAVVPEHVCGPGWSNSVVWVYIESLDGSFRQECIQVMERTPSMHVLFNVGAEMCSALIEAVPHQFDEEKEC